MQATALGRYLLYGPDATMPAVGLIGAVGSTSTPGPSADWTANAAGTGFTLTARTNGQALGVGLGGRLVQVAPASAAALAFVPATGCADFPEIQVNATGAPLRGPARRRPCAASSTTTPHQGVRVPRRALPLRARRGARTA